MNERPVKAISVLQRLVNDNSRNFWYPKSLQAGLKEAGISISVKTITNHMSNLINLGDAVAMRDSQERIIGYKGIGKEFYNISSLELFKGWLRSVEYKTIATLSFYLVMVFYFALRGLVDLLVPL